MVGGAEDVVLEYVGGVVESTGVFECDCFVSVDVPDLGVDDVLHGCFVAECVVEGADAAGELVAVSSVEFGGDVGVASAVEGGHRGFLGVGVGVAEDEDWLGCPVVLVFQVVDECLCLCDANVGVVALAVAGVGVSTSDRALGLEVVDYADEGFLAVVEWLEFLCEWLACGAGEGCVVEDSGFADGLDGGLVVDEGDADVVFIGAQLFWRFDGRPAIGSNCLVECCDEGIECVIATGDVAGDGRGVFDFFKSKNIDVKAVDCFDDLALLIFECFFGVSATDVTVVGGDWGVVDIPVCAAAWFIFAERGEVVEHVEACDVEFASNVID